MVNLNVFDTVWDAVEEYNNYVKRSPSGSYEERRGVFYNAIRRRINVGHARKPYSSLFANDIECQFDEQGRLTGFVINKKFEKDPYPAWGDDKAFDRVTELNQLKQLTIEHPVFYPTKILNEMFRIVNSIK